MLSLVLPFLWKALQPPQAHVSLPPKIPLHLFSTCLEVSTVCLHAYIIAQVFCCQLLSEDLLVLSIVYSLSIYMGCG